MAHWKGSYCSEQSPLAPSFSVCLPGKTNFIFAVQVCSIFTLQLSAFVYFVQHCSCQNGSLWLRTSCTIGSLCKTLQPWKAAGSLGFQVLVLADPSWKASAWIVFISCWSTTRPISVLWKRRGGATARLRECDRRFEQPSSFFQRAFLNSLYGLLTRWTSEWNPVDLGNVPSDVPGSRHPRSQWRYFCTFMWNISGEHIQAHSDAEKVVDRERNRKRQWDLKVGVNSWDVNWGCAADRDRLFPRVSVEHAVSSSATWR